MKNIVVGIDFSNNSINSMKHAVAISLKTGGKLHLVWVKTPGAAKGLGKGSIDDFTKEANRKLELLAKECRAETPNSEVQVVILEGKTFEVLPQYAANLESALIVIGTHGISGFEEQFLGSNAFKLVCASTVPILILREGIQINRDLTQILAPIDISFETLQKVKPAIAFAKAFGAKILLEGFHLHKDKEGKHVVEVQCGHAAKLCLNANVRHDIEIREYENAINDAVIQCAEQKDVNLMVIMRESESGGLFIKNTVQQLLITTPMPLLTIPNVNHFSITK